MEQKIKKYIFTICEKGSCELIVRNYDEAPTYCPFDPNFGSFKWKEIKKEIIMEEVKACPFCGKLPEGPNIDGIVYHRPDGCCPLGNSSYFIDNWNYRVADLTQEEKR